MKPEMAEQLKNHPCFNEGACADHARIHLPVAPACNVQCGFCNRKYDCVNESRPGVTSSVLSPGQALYYLERSMEKRNFDVAGIAGPGDPFANPVETMETLRLIREKYPRIMLCVATNGLNIGPYIDGLAALDVSHVTLTINGVDPDIAGSCYRWIRYNRKVYRGRVAGEIMIREQLNAVEALVAKGILVKVNSIIIPGINDSHIPAVAEEVGKRGAVTQNCLPLLPVRGTDFGHLPHPGYKDVTALREICGDYIAQMGHCRRCRADAAGLLEEAMESGITSLLKEAASLPLIPGEDRPFIAVATREGMLVNQHLGHAAALCIYKQQEDSLWTFLEKRNMPPSGGGDERWDRIGETIKDCSVLLVSGIGNRPAEVLGQQGIKIYQVEGMITQALESLDRGEDLTHMSVRKSACTGNAEGCA